MLKVAGYSTGTQKETAGLAACRFAVVPARWAADRAAPAPARGVNPATITAAGI